MLFESEEADLAVVKLGASVGRRESAGRREYAVYPSMTFPQPAFGMSVGYVAQFHRPDGSGENELYIGFWPASLSVLPTDMGRWALAGGGLAEIGFSGAPVFTPDGGFAGVLVQTVQLWSEHRNSAPQGFRLAIMSPLWPFRDQIEDAIAK